MDRWYFMVPIKNPRSIFSIWRIDKKNLIDKDKKKKKKRKFGPDDEYDHNVNEPDYTGGYGNHLHNDNRNHLQ